MTKAYSSVGDRNLHSVGSSERFTEWMYAQIKPHLHGSILEIGSGTGTYSEKLVHGFPNTRIVLTDFDPSYVNALQVKYKSPTVKAQLLDFGSAESFAALGESFDSAFALNVLEHVEDDVQALANVYENLKPGGTFVVLVPAHPFLYNCMDEAVGHYRRYTKQVLIDKARRAGFEVKKIFYFNFLSIPGWYVNGTLLRKSTIGGGLMRIYDVLIPGMRFAEKYVFRQTLGISLIAVLKKP